MTSPCLIGWGQVTHTDGEPLDAWVAALRATGIAPDAIDSLDVVHCQSWPYDDPAGRLAERIGATPGRTAYTVTGGLPYAGGAGSSYVLSSLATMADRLRDGGGHGLVSGVGMHMTRHAAAVLSSSPGSVRVAPPDPGLEVRRPVVDAHRGTATVAAYTVHHGRDGVATDAVLVCDVGEEGARCYAAATDAGLLADLEAEEWVGRTVRLADGGDGVNLVVGTGRAR